MFDFSNFRKLWNKARKEAGVDGFRFYGLRHTCASHVMMASGNHAAVQGLLRLKTPGLVMRYGHLAPGFLRQIAQSLDQRLFLKVAESAQIEPKAITNPITTPVEALPV
ncbi:MAG: tyrosine-type recombinase/integrase [Elusimicrobiota bacterium]